MLSVSIAKEFAGFALDVTLDAPAGVTAVFGPSGSGKTSVIRAIAGLLACDRAEVSLQGRGLAKPCPVLLHAARRDDAVLLAV